MEGALIARDRVGVQDFVLLDSHTSEAAFLNNLRKRYQENLIYVSACCVDSCSLWQMKCLRMCCIYIYVCVSL